MKKGRRGIKEKENKRRLRGEEFLQEGSVLEVREQTGIKQAQRHQDPSSRPQQSLSPRTP